MSKSTKPMARCAVIRINNAAADVFGRSGRRHCKCKVKAVATFGSSSKSCTNSKDYYQVLSLEHSPAVGAAEIKRAYRRLALRYHPDLCPPSRRAESTELFLELRRAYETLSDPAQRVRYDAELRTTTGGEEVDGAWEAATSRDVEFSRDVWEAQLRGLHARSELRQRARNGWADYVH